MPPQNDVPVDGSKLGLTFIDPGRKQGQWSLLLRLASVTTVAVDHTRGLLLVHRSTTYCIRSAVEYTRHVSLLTSVFYDVTFNVWWNLE